MRYIIYGAGAIGGVIGANLQLAGKDVVYIARGKHLEALQTSGLTLLSPNGRQTLPVTAVGHPRDIVFAEGDAVILAMKGQDTVAALDALHGAAGSGVPVICTQNGVVNERFALRRFQHVYAMVVMLPATHMEPGVVQQDSAPTVGILDSSVYPTGTDDFIAGVCRDLEEANFSAKPDPLVMRYKYTKLLMNLNNAFQVVCGADADGGEVSKRARTEALACYAAAGIDFATDEEFYARRGNYITVKPVEGGRRVGSSSWQSVERGTGSVEADYLNGEICLLGRLHGVPTPVNRALQDLANDVARSGRKPGIMSPEALLAMVDGAS